MQKIYAKMALVAILGQLLAACAPTPEVRIAAGADRDLLPKAALLNRPLAAVATAPKLLPGLLQPVAALPEAMRPLVAGLAVDAVAFDIGQSVLTVVAARNGEPLAPVALYKIAGHFDLTPRPGSADPAPELVRDQQAHARWQDRGFIEVNPAGLLAASSGSASH